MKTIESYSKILKALSDKNRLRILKMLQVKSLCVCEITDILKLATSTVSNHLTILKNSGLITEQKDGKWVNYMLNVDQPDKELFNEIKRLKNILEDDNQILADRKKVKKVDRELICIKI